VFPKVFFGALLSPFSNFAWSEMPAIDFPDPAYACDFPFFLTKIALSTAPLVALGNMTRHYCFDFAPRLPPSARPTAFGRVFP